MKILLISGFLGAGKTTFIKELVKHTDKLVAILENEISGINIDASTLRDGEVNIWEMTEGCICCSTGGDFATSVLTIANSINPEYLIVEPTGVGMLSKIIKNVQQIEYEHISLLAPLSIVDADNYENYLSEYPAIASDQISNARHIVISKLSGKDAFILGRIEAVIRHYNPEAVIISGDYRNLGDDFWNVLLSTRYDGTIIEQEKEPEDLETLAVKDAYIDNVYSLYSLLEDILRYRYGEIIRAKGTVYIEDMRLSFDLVASRYSILISYKDELDKEALYNKDVALKQSNMVFIGRYVDRKPLIDRLRHKSGYRKISLRGGL